MAEWITQSSAKASIPVQFWAAPPEKRKENKMAIVFAFILGLISGSFVMCLCELLKECDEIDRKMDK